MAGEQNGVPMPSEPSSVEQLTAKVMGYATGALTAHLIYIGEKLGLFSCLKKAGRVTPQELADAAGVSERWTREWLYQQAAAGLISTDKEAKQFWLNSDQLQVLVNETGPDASPYCLAGMVGMVPHLLTMTDKLVEAFKTGRGMSFDAHGYDIACGTCRLCGVSIRHDLVRNLCTVPGIEDKLKRGIAVADVGCGAGQALFTLAERFPACTYHGYDISSTALALAKQRQEELGLLGHNITFHNVKDGDMLPAAPTYDLIFTLDALHDMTQPSTVMKAIRQAIKDDGTWITCDPRGMPTPGENILHNPVAPMLYGMSVHICMSSGLSEEGGRGLGTLGYQEALAREMTQEAGFTQFSVLNWPNPLNNFFMMAP